MKKWKSNYNNINYVKILPLVVIFAILSISIGFSAFSSTLGIDGAKVEVRIVKNIRITNVNVDSTNNSIVKYNDYDVSTLLSRVDLKNSDFSTFTTYFDNTLLFGAGHDEKLKLRRFIKGTLSDIHVKIY